jgi:hypothetical protein
VLTFLPCGSCWPVIFAHLNHCITFLQNDGSPSHFISFLF